VRVDQRKHTVALSMVRATMAATFARAAEEAAGAGGELENAQAEAAKTRASFHEMQNKLSKAAAEQEELAEQMEQMFDMYVGFDFYNWV
jgi:hypothetical protein